MKKFMLLAVTAFMAASASSQVLSSYSYASSKTPTLWYARLGVSFNNVAGAGEVAEAGMDGPGDSSLGCRAGMDIDFGFQRPMGSFGLYWGMEFGIGTRGGAVKYEYDEEFYDGTEKGHITTWNVKYSPFTFGYKYSVTDDIKLDAHLGAYISYDFSGKSVFSWGNDYDEDEKLSISELKDSEWDFQPLDAGIQFGIGVWWKRFNLDLTYQRGFVPAAKPIIQYYDKTTSSYYHSDAKLYSGNFMIRLGVAF